jgi:hypothetical protein
MPQVTSSESAIWARVIDARNGNLPANAARGILALGFTDADKARMSELARKNNEGMLREAERTELESYVKVGDILSLLHLKAKKSLGG